MTELSGLIISMLAISSIHFYYVYLNSTSPKTIIRRFNDIHLTRKSKKSEIFINFGGHLEIFTRKTFIDSDYYLMCFCIIVMASSYLKICKYLICYLGSLKAKQLICFHFVSGHFGFSHLAELAHTIGGYLRSFLRVVFADIKSIFKPLYPYNGHGFTISFLYYIYKYILVHNNKRSNPGNS